MRVSVEREDPGYHQAAHRCRVFLEGAERGNVITADEERRWAKLYRLDDQGQIVVRAGKPQTEEFFGHVRVDPPIGWELMPRLPCEPADGLSDC